MAMRVSEVREWLSKLADDELVAVGEDVLGLVVVGTYEGDYIEIGGEPLPEGG